MTKIQVLYFGEIAEIVGKEKDFATFLDLNEFKEKLFTDFPELQSKVFQLAINNKMMQENYTFKEDDILAVLPPFSGG